MLLRCLLLGHGSGETLGKTLKFPISFVARSALSIAGYGYISAVVWRVIASPFSLKFAKCAASASLCPPPSDTIWGMIEIDCRWITPLNYFPSLEPEKGKKHACH